MIILKLKIEYLIAIAIGILVTPGAIFNAYIERGCRAYGGELLIIPALLLLVFLVNQIKEMWRCVGWEKQKED